MALLAKEALNRTEQRRRAGEYLIPSRVLPLSAPPSLAFCLSLLLRFGFFLHLHEHLQHQDYMLSEPPSPPLQVAHTHPPAATRTS